MARAFPLVVSGPGDPAAPLVPACCRAAGGGGAGASSTVRDGVDVEIVVRARPRRPPEEARRDGSEGVVVGEVAVGPLERG